jgi:cell division protein FtsL
VALLLLLWLQQLQTPASQALLLLVVILLLVMLVLCGVMLLWLAYLRRSLQSTAEAKSVWRCADHMFHTAAP